MVRIARAKWGRAVKPTKGGGSRPIQKVLIVDEDPHMQRVVELTLQSVGKWAVAKASSGFEAMEIAAAEHPDVILLDVMMPGMDGPTTLRKLREQPDTAQIPVIFMTAKVQSQEIAQYLRLGAAGVI